MATTSTGTGGAKPIARGIDDTIILNHIGGLVGDTRIDTGIGNDNVINFKEGGALILLGKGNDTYIGTGFTFLKTIRGDIVKGGDGNDAISVTTRQSSYFGENGNDRFLSIGQQNSFDGGADIDSISYILRDYDSLLSGRGIDIDLHKGAAQTRAFRTERLTSIENAEGTNVGDRIFGSNVANALNGRGGNDTLAGRAGNDVLTGGNGTDVLQGDGGADHFDFNTRAESAVGARRDVILDFDRGERDRIDLRDIDAHSGKAGDQAFTFIGDRAFSGAAGELRFKNGVAAGDINGDGRADFEIEVRGMTSLSKGDFLL